MRRKDIFYYNYYKLVELYNSNLKSSKKIKVLVNLLSYFDINFNNLNSNELKLYKNILLMSKEIINDVHDTRYFKDSKEDKYLCNTSVKNIESKLNKK